MYKLIKMYILDMKSDLMNIMHNFHYYLQHNRHHTKYKHIGLKNMQMFDNLELSILSKKSLSILRLNHKPSIGMFQELIFHKLHSLIIDLNM